MRTNEKKPVEAKKSQRLESKLGTGEFDMRIAKGGEKKEIEQLPLGGKENKNQVPYLDVESFIMG